MGTFLTAVVWLILVVGITRAWGPDRFWRRLPLVGLACLFPFPVLALMFSYWHWRKRLGPVEVWTPRMRRAADRAAPPWASRGVVDYRPWGSQRGGILLWAVCSMFVLSTALVLVTTTTIRAGQARRSTEQRLAALGIAEREMDRLKAIPFADLPALGRHSARWDGLVGLPHAAGAIIVEPGPVDGMRKITLQVRWQDANGPERVVELAALRGPHG